MESLRNALRTIARPFTLKVGRRPLGIWLAWLMLAFAALLQRQRLFDIAYDPLHDLRTYFDVILNWTVWVIAVVALFMRREVVQIFGAIVCANLLVFSVSQTDWLGAAIAILGFIGLMVNRRWYDARLPNVW